MKQRPASTVINYARTFHMGAHVHIICLWTPSPIYVIPMEMIRNCVNALGKIPQTSQLGLSTNSLYSMFSLLL